MDGDLPERHQAPCVVHLVRAVNGLERLQAFAGALRRHPPGVDHQLVFIMKGFESLEQVQPYLEETQDLRPETLFFSDFGRDLDVYFAAAARLRRDRYCFLNSYSLPLAEGWLRKLDAALAQPGVGLVGATGSWESVRSWTAYSLGLPSAYRGTLPAAPLVRRELLTLEARRTAGGRRSLREGLQRRATTVRRLPEQERFPAQHIRTNAFMLSQATIERLSLHAVAGKLDALALESGRNSITRQVQRLGLRTLVVDRAGESFAEEQWYRSNTYWRSDQEGLLVADNRTLLYERADPALRSLLAGLTWGGNAWK